MAKGIGIEDLKIYDENLEFLTGNAKPHGDAAWIVENGKKMYEELSAETGEFFQFMIDHELMDLEAKKGKESGGYCTFIENYEAPYIFSNFNGTSGDIDVLTHEAGHAFQVYSSKNIGIPEYLWPTTESCEIHSMSMEFFTWPWMELFFKEETEKYKFSHLSGGLLFLPYGVAVDEFQHVIYENPEMTPAERKAESEKVLAELDEMIEAEVESYSLPLPISMVDLLSLVRPNVQQIHDYAEFRISLDELDSSCRQ